MDRVKWACALAFGLSLVMPAATARAADKPVPTPVAAFLEITAGSASGALLGYAVGKGIASGGDCGSIAGEECANRITAALIGVYVGYAIGNPLGIWVSGSAMGQGGSAAGAIIGGALGQILALPIAYVLAIEGGEFALPVLLVFPAAMGTWCYHASGTPIVPSQSILYPTPISPMAVVRWPAEARPRSLGFRATLLEFAF